MQLRKEKENCKEKELAGTEKNRDNMSHWSSVADTLGEETEESEDNTPRSFQGETPDVMCTIREIEESQTRTRTKSWVHGTAVTMEEQIGVTFNTGCKYGGEILKEINE